MGRSHFTKSEGRRMSDEIVKQGWAFCVENLFVV